MLNTELTYIDRTFKVSDQLPEHVVALQESITYSEQLMGVLIEQMKKKEGSSGTEEDFKKWREPTERISKELIVRASQKGVYDLTKEELVDNNPAFKKLHGICSECMEGMRRALLQAMSDYLEGYDKAYNKAASNITGPGFGVLTNSFASAMLYEAVAYSAMKQQARQADREFSDSLSKLNASSTDRTERELTKVKTKYYMDVKEIIPSIIANMMEVYFKKLDSVGAIKLSDLDSYDMQASDAILRNLDVVDSKADVLYKAFEKCPYNPTVYIKAANYGLLNEATYDTAKYLHQENGLVSAIQEGCNKSISSKRIDLILPSIKLLAHIKQQTVESVAKEEFSDVIAQQNLEYMLMKKATKGEEDLKTWVKSCISSDANQLCNFDKEEVYSAVRRKVDNIISEEEYNLYRELHVVDSEDIALDGKEMGDDLKAINGKYIDVLAPLILSFIEQLRIKRDIYQEAYNNCQKEREKLKDERDMLAEERKKLSILKFSAKKELNSKIANIDNDIACLDTKYNIRQLEDDYLKF